MLNGSSQTRDRIGIHVEASELPEDDEALAALAIELGTAIREVLEARGIEPDDLRCTNGHSYAAIPDRCPVCDKHLELTEFSLDASNGGHASARCDCGWTGDAIYRLIDLHERRETSDTEFLVDPEKVSSVHLHDVEPRYVPY